MLEIASWITGVGGAVGLIVIAARHILRWPETDAVILDPTNGQGQCALTVINDGNTHIEVVRVRTLWPRNLLFGYQRYGKAPQPWEPPPSLPIDWKSSLDIAEVVPPGERRTLTFLVSNFPIESNSQTILAEFRSARFSARRSWKPVKMLAMASAKNMIA